MPTPSGIQDALGGIFGNMFKSGTAKYMTYAGYLVYTLIIFGVFYLIYALINYKYKVTIFEGSIEKDDNKKEVITINKVKRDRAKLINIDGVSKWKLMWSRKKINPLPYKNIQPGNHCFLFRTANDIFNPINIKAGNPSAYFNADPFDVAFYYLGVQQDAKDYAKDDTLKKQQMLMIATVVLCLVAVVVVTWITMKYVGHTADKIELASSAWQQLTSGVAPN